MTEIAQALDIPLGTARSRLRRARERLEAELRETIESRDQLSSTLQNLDGWAKQLRDTVDKANKNRPRGLSSAGAQLSSRSDRGTPKMSAPLE